MLPWKIHVLGPPSASANSLVGHPLPRNGLETLGICRKAELANPCSWAPGRWCSTAPDLLEAMVSLTWAPPKGGCDSMLANYSSRGTVDRCRLSCNVFKGNQQLPFCDVFHFKCWLTSGQLSEACVRPVGCHLAASAEVGLGSQLMSSSRPLSLQLKC